MNEALPTSRKAAKAAGVKKFMGRPCKHGHNAPRYTSSGACIICAHIRAEAWNERHKAGRGYHSFWVLYVE